MRQLTSLDAQFLALETPRQSGHVGALAILDDSERPGGKLEIEDICNLMSERLSLLPPLRWRLTEVPFGLDYPYWIEDPDFDLDFHVRELALPSPGTDAKLAEQVARIIARPLDRSRPLWELYLIHGLESGGVGMLTKIHHALIDGLSGAEIMGVLFDLAPEGRDLDEVRPVRPDREPSDLEMLARGLAGVPRYPVRMLRSLPAALPNLTETPFGTLPGTGVVSRVADRVQRAVGGDGSVRDRNTLRAPKTSFNRRVSAHRRFAFGQLSLDEVKAIKNEHGCTVNDVVVAICTGAVRRWLIEHGELPSEPLVAQIPVSVRNERAGRHLREPDHADERTTLHQPAGPGREAPADPRGAGGHEGASQGTPGGIAPGREPLHSARGVRARRARDLRAVDELAGAADMEPRDLERAGAADPALLRRRAPRRELPGLGHHGRDGPEHDRHELLRPPGLRPRRRPRPDARPVVDDRMALGVARGAAAQEADPAVVAGEGL